MTTDIQRFFRCYAIAKEFLGYYWKHDGDYPELGRVRVENIQKAVEDLTGKKIVKKLVDFQAEHLRSVTEIYDDGTARIYIRENQKIEWQKYGAVKEYSHLLYDDPREDYEVDPVKILKFLTSNTPFQLDAGHTPAEVSEKMTEILTLEIIYPIEWREEDRAFLENGGQISELVEKRHVPAVHIQRGCSEAAIASSKAIWDAMNAARDD